MEIPTSADVIEAFRAFLQERADAGVAAARAVSDVRYEDRTVTIDFDAATAGFERAVLLGALPFDNWADFAGQPIAFDNPSCNRIRAAVDRVSTRLTDGHDLGSRSAAEIYRAATGLAM